MLSEALLGVKLSVLYSTRILGDNHHRKQSKRVSYASIEERVTHSVYPLDSFLIAATESFEIILSHCCHQTGYCQSDTWVRILHHGNNAVRPVGHGQDRRMLAV
jgi:hypothetical protein